MFSDFPPEKNAPDFLRVFAPSRETSFSEFVTPGSISGEAQIRKARKVDRDVPARWPTLGGEAATFASEMRREKTKAW